VLIDVASGVGERMRCEHGVGKGRLAVGAHALGVSELCLIRLLEVRLLT